MSIWGTGSAQFQFPGDSVVTLEHSTMQGDYILPDIIEHKSIITGKKHFINNGDYSEFTVNVYLYKYADASAKFSEIYDYLHTNVYFWPHNDGKAISGSDSSPTEFFISDMSLSYLEDANYNDLLTIKFVASDYTVVSKSLV